MYRNPKWTRNDFEVLRVSDVDLEHLAIELYWHDEPVFTIDQEDGPDNLHVTIVSTKDSDFQVRFPLRDLEWCLEAAKSRLRD